MWRDDAYLLDMLIHARRARSFNDGVTYERFASDQVLQDATCHVLQIIGEAAGKLSPEFRTAHAEIPWQRIIGLRHRLVHDYPRIELPKVWNVVENYIEPLIQALEPLVPPEQPDTGDARQHA